MTTMKLNLSIFQHMFEHVIMTMLTITDRLFSCYTLPNSWVALEKNSRAVPYILIECYLSMQLISLPKMTKLSVKYSKLNIHTYIINAMELRLFYRLFLLIPGLLRQHPHFKTTGILFLKTSGIHKLASIHLFLTQIPIDETIS